MGNASSNFKLITAARLIDGTGSPPLERGAVLVEGDTIRAVGTEETVIPPEGASVERLDYKGTVLPGLVDCHVHLIGIGDGRPGDDLNKLPDEVLTLQAASNARTHLYSGVTTVRDCGAKHRTTFMLRRAVEMGITPAPRLVLAGRPVAIVGGHLSYFGVEATGEVECRAAVRQLIKEGADFIKITATGGTTQTSFPLRPSFTVQEMTAACDEAHKFGKHACAHCVSSQGIVNALDAGIDTIFHARFNEPDGSVRFQPEIADRIARQGVFVNPTLHVKRARIWAFEQQIESGPLDEDEQSAYDELRREYDSNLVCFQGLRDAGVTMVSGSDSAWGNYTMGGFPHEIEANVEAGMTPLDAVVSATGDSAKSCAIHREVGTLEPGKKADILVVDGDPSQDINALWNVADVFQNGALVDRRDFV
ncbi:MAG: amidohydrolase family protein [Chloroflexi bacterium]|nr:amidohydrolase family protein [Chloroflexota bacterium]